MEQGAIARAAHKSDSFDVDVDLFDDAACGHDLAIHCLRPWCKSAQRPVAIGSEKAEVARGRCRDLSCELAARVEQPYIRPGDRIPARNTRP